MNTQLETQLIVAAIVSWLIQWVKNNPKTPWLNFDTARLNRIVAIIAALLTGAGILFKYDATAGILTVIGLTQANLSMLVWHAIQQFVLQHLVYRVAIAPPKPGAEQAAARMVKP